MDKISTNPPDNTTPKFSSYFTTILLLAIVFLLSFVIALHNQRVKNETKLISQKLQQTTKIKKDNESPTYLIKPTTTWETYDTTLFTFNYPRELTENKGSLRNSILYIGPTSKETKEELFESNKYDNNAGEIKKILINNKTAYVRHIVSSAIQTQVVITDIPYYENNKVERGLLYFSIYNNSDESDYKNISNQIISSIKFKNLNYQDMLSLILNNIKFEIPQTWWYEHDTKTGKYSYSKDKTSDAESYIINTLSNAAPMYDHEFHIIYYPIKIEGSYGTVLFNKNFHTWKQEQEIVIDGVKSKRIEIKRNNEEEPNSSYRPGELIGIVIIPEGGGEYILSGAINAPESRKNFDQILSTFEFTN